MKDLFKSYRETIEYSCTGTSTAPLYSVEYWQNKLFANTIKAILPLSLITLLPGTAFSLSQGLFVLAGLNTLSMAILLWIAFGRSMSIPARKFLFIGLAYLVGIYLLTFIGFKGPGLVYLLTACTFALIILPSRYAYLWSWINVLICVLYAAALHYGWTPVQGPVSMSTAEWIAISVNLIFLSFLSSFLVPGLFKGIGSTFKRQKVLEKELREKQKEQDLTFQKLEAKNRELEQFVHFASHELKEPVRMVNAFLQRFHGDYYPMLEEKGRQYIDFAMDGGNRMSRLIHDLLEYSMAESTTIKRVNVDLSNVVSSLITLMDDTIEKTDAKITYQDLPVLTTDRHLIEIILKNLISNGIKYHREGVPPEVAITAYQSEGEWHISVKDNGIGLERKEFDRIFELFQRLHKEPGYSGTGIGLAVVRKSVDLLGGTITVNSAPGLGSEFIVTIREEAIN
ncbi:MAG: ATP-binding protein [Balneolaceae bacterium]